MSPSGFDQRTARRARLALPLEFWIATDEEDLAYSGQTINLSEGGLAFHARHAARKHDILIVGLSLTGLEKPLRLSARVIYSQPAESLPGQHEMRVQFLEPGEDERRALRAQVDGALGPAPARPGGLQLAQVEERRSPRLEVSLEVRFREISAPELGKILEARTHLSMEAFSEARHFHNAMTVLSENISVGGLRLLMDKPMAQGTNLLLEIRLPEPPLPLHALAVVLWCQASDAQPGKYSTGVRFLGISKADALKVEYFVSKKAGA